MARALGFVPFFIYTGPFWLALYLFSDATFWQIDSRLPLVLLTSLGQAMLSTVGALFLGAIIGAGLANFRSHARGLVEFAVLLPGLLPTLVMIAGHYQILPELRGFLGTVTLHVLVNMGAVAVFVSRMFEKEISRWSELAWLEGASSFQFAIAVGKALSLRLWSVGLFVFAGCFMSFAIPLMMGGKGSATIETLIFEKIKLGGNWGQVLQLALVQLAVLVVLATFAKKSKVSETRAATLKILNWRWTVILGFVPYAWIVAAFWRSSWSSMPEGWSETFLASLFVGLFTGSLVMCSLIATVACVQTSKWNRILSGMVAPSGILTGFVLLYFWRDTGFASLIKNAIGLSLIFIPVLYRLGLASEFDTLVRQREVASVLGASSQLSFLRIVLPQIWRRICILSGIAAFWAWGDFTVANSILEKNHTFAATTQALLATYRVDVASGMLLILIFGATVSFAIFGGLSYVGPKRN